MTTRSNSRPKETSVSVTGIGTTGNCISMFRYRMRNSAGEAADVFGRFVKSRRVCPGDGSRFSTRETIVSEVGRADRRRVRAGRRFHLLVYTASPSRRQSVFITDLHGGRFFRSLGKRYGLQNKRNREPIPIRMDRRSPVEERVMRVYATAAFYLSAVKPASAARLTSAAIIAVAFGFRRCSHR